MKTRSDPATGARAPARLVLAVCAGLGLVCAAPAAPTLETGRLSIGSRHGYATSSHSCAVVEGGDLQCWGAAELGQTGDGSLARRRPLPVRVPGLEQVRSVAAGGSHTCVVAAGRAVCFGDNGHGQTGAARPFVVLAPAPVAGLPGSVTAVGAGRDHSCAVSEGRVFCWGRNEAGESGAVPERDCRQPFRVRRCSVAPTPVEGVPVPADALALGVRHGCALAAGRVYCWGANGEGQLGDGTREGRPRAARVPGLPDAVTAIASGDDHACALAGARLWCWGGGRDAATPVSGLAPGLQLVAAGGRRTCAASAQRAWCFQPGVAPREVPGLEGAILDPAEGAILDLAEGAILDLAVGADHACVLQGRTVRCWGENGFGQLGSGDAPRAHERAEPIAAWDAGRLRDVDGDGRLALVCLGDSNTVTMPGAWPSWCDRLPELLPAHFRVANRGQGGGTATASASLLPAAAPLAYALENDAPDVAVLAYGTNDLLARAPVTEVVAALAGHVRALLADGAFSLVALVPPVRSDDTDTNRAIRELNDALRQAFPERLVDFATGFGDEQLVDRVHLDERAQLRRARLVADVLAELQPEPDP